MTRYSKLVNGVHRMGRAIDIAVSRVYDTEFRRSGEPGYPPVNVFAFSNIYVDQKLRPPIARLDYLRNHAVLLDHLTGHNVEFKYPDPQMFGKLMGYLETLAELDAETSG